MHERNSLRRGACWLGVLLLSLAATAGAAESVATSEQVFSLHLEETIEFGESLEAESSETPEPAAVATAPVANWNVAISAAELRGSEAVLEAQAEDRVTPRSGGFGKWLKKRWYIPVIAAVLIGVVASDDDDNDEDSED